MHSSSIRRADDWLKKHIDPYAKWAQTHNSMLIVTWDEGRGSNHIPTFVTGQMIKRGSYSVPISHFSILSTIESMYGLPRLGSSTTAPPIRRMFKAVSGAVTPAAVTATTHHKHHASDVLT